MATFHPLVQSAHLIVLLPFLAGALIILLPLLFDLPILGDLLPATWFNRDSRCYKTFAMILSVGAVAWGFVQSLFIFDQLAKTGRPYIVDVPWFVSGSFTLTTGLLVDNLTTVMLIVVTLVSLLVQIYTHAYMREDPGYARFYSYLSLFTGSMLGLVVSTNLFQMYLFWELVGVCSYFLIGFWWYKSSAADACLKAFVVNRVGDFGFLIGVLMLLAATWGFWQAHPGHGILTFADNNGVDLQRAIQWAFANHGFEPALPLTVIACIMFMGPMAKSAQMPLHAWLPDAMEGPTPISALIHAATMVAAGVYMVARAYPVWLNWADPSNPVAQGSAALAFVAWIGGITAFMAATIAFTQFDIKRGLAWSTVSQLGYMFVGLGVGTLTGGMFHLFTHAFFKAMLFLCSGAVIHALHGEQDMRNMGGLRSKLPFTHFCFLVGCVAITGVLPFSGFFSKDEIISAAMHWEGPMHAILGPLMVLTAAMTAFYMFRMYFMTFHNDYRGTVHPHEEKHVTPLTAPLLALAVPSIAAGYLGIAVNGGESPFGAFIHFGHTAPEPMNFGVMGMSAACALFGLAIAYMVYGSRQMHINESLGKIDWLYQFSFNRWYWDDVYRQICKFCIYVFRGTWTLVDRFIIDNLVNFFASSARMIGGTLRYSENGRGQYYALIIFAFVAGIAWFVYFFTNLGASQ